MQTAYAYTPKFELWMNGLVWQAIYNVINSYNVIESEMGSYEGRMLSISHAPHDVFIGRVRVLEDTVLSIQKKDSIYETETSESYDSAKETDHYHKVYRAILGLLQRNGHVRFKPPRDFAED